MTLEKDHILRKNEWQHTHGQYNNSVNETCSIAVLYNINTVIIKKYDMSLTTK
jgi:hypothetical protein